MGFQTKNSKIFDLIKDKVSCATVVLLTVFSVSFLVSRDFFIFMLFVGLDLLNNYIKMSINFETLDFVFLGLIFLSFYSTPSYAFLFIYVGLLIRLILGRFQKHHLIKQGIMTFFVFILPVLKEYSLILIGTVFIILRYLIEFLVNLFVLREFNSDRLLIRFFNFISGFIFLSIADFLIKLFI